jgi:Kef-type K+ transport system membrane component KefB
MRRYSIWVLLALLFPLMLHAASGESHFEPGSSVILWVTILFTISITGRYIAELLKHPGVLGELLIGVLLGNIGYYFAMPLVIILREGAAPLNIMTDLLSGVPMDVAIDQTAMSKQYADDVREILLSPGGVGWLKVAYVIDTFSRYGLIFLLFMVGLETSVDELKHTGAESIKVALIGVFAPMILGLLFMYFAFPSSSYKTDLFVAATLAATSIGITARVLKEMAKLKTREGKTIIGAAMLDDILGLVLLAIVSGIVVGGAVNVYEISRIIIFSVLFFTIALLLGPYFLTRMLKLFKFMDPWEVKLFVSFLFIMLLAWFATMVHLAMIIGAFAAGIIVHEGYFKKGDNNIFSRLTLSEMVAPLEFLLTPLFFILIGMQVKIEMFADWSVIFLSSGLIVTAVIGKLVSGYGAHKKDDRLLVGIGMLPRGEVGLIFASTGRKLNIMSDELFSAIILMVIVTTFIAPPLLKMRYKHDRHKQNATPT